MTFIFTTATAVQKIKMVAKAIANDCNISHTKALEQAAKQAGYTDWFHVQKCQKGPTPSAVKPDKTLSWDEQIQRYSNHLAALARAPVTVHSIKGDVFHDVTIEGHRFRGLVLPCSNPVIIKLDLPMLIEAGGVALGVASIRPNGGKSNANSEWWICKYSSKEPRLDLSGMTEEGRNALAHEFGLPVIPNEGLNDPTLIWSHFVNGREDRLFYLSPAFMKLVTWTKTHLRKAKSSNKNSLYLKRWMEVAMEHPSFPG